MNNSPEKFISDNGEKLLKHLPPEDLELFKAYINLKIKEGVESYQLNFGVFQISMVIGIIAIILAIVFRLTTNSGVYNSGFEAGKEFQSVTNEKIIDSKTLFCKNSEDFIKTAKQLCE